MNLDGEKNVSLFLLISTENPAFPFSRKQITVLKHRKQITVLKTASTPLFLMEIADNFMVVMEDKAHC